MIQLTFHDEIRLKMYRFARSAVSLCEKVIRHGPGKEKWGKVALVTKIFYYCTAPEEKSTKHGSIFGNVLGSEGENKVDTEELQKMQENSWKTMKVTLVVFGITFTCIGSYLIYELGRPKIDSSGNLIEDEYSRLPFLKQYLYRTLGELNYYKRLINEPSRDKLLPDVLPYPYHQPPYTVVLEMTDVLVHPDWTYNTGWRFKKRPGIENFLQSIHGLYEVVIYTAEMGMTVFPIIEALDPKNIISYKLVRDATHFIDGHHVKDLDRLNRDLSKVIVIDWNSDSIKFHQDNVLKIPRWSGNDDDTTLLDLASFLRVIAHSEIKDVREVLRYYREFENPLDTFKDRQRQLAIQLENQLNKK